MTTADFGICPAHGPVAAKHDFSIGVIVVCIVLAVLLFGIGLLILLIYILYVLFSKDRVCPFCGSVLYAWPVPVYPLPYYAPAYYPYPPYPPPYYPRGR